MFTEINKSAAAQQTAPAKKQIDQDGKPQPAAAQISHEQALQAAVAFILNQIDNPVDVWAVAATLESRGERDIDAVEKYGKADIFDLATDIYNRCRIYLRLQELVDIAVRHAPDNANIQQISTLLKARGLTDAEAIANFNQPNLAALAQEVQRHCQKRLENNPATSPGSRRSTRFWQLARNLSESLGRFLKFYGRGSFFAIPMAMQIFSVLVYGFGLWASLDFTEEAATAVVVGTILSFVVTGGFVQAIGRLGLFYTEQQSYILAKAIAFRLIHFGLATTLIVGLAWYISNLFMPYFPQRVILVSLIYYLLLASLWLYLAVLYMRQERLAVVIITLVGLVVIGWVLNGLALGLEIAVIGWTPWLVETLLNSIPASVNFIAWFLQAIINLVDGLGLTDPYYGTPWTVYAAHWIGLTVAILLTFLWGHRKLFKSAYWLQQQSGGNVASLKVARLPRPSIVTYSVFPYFSYGLLYFAYLFLDRVVGWTSGDQPLPLLIWFRTPYELGLDWALLALLLTIAMLEYTINEFSAIITREQKARKTIHIEPVEKLAQKKPPHAIARQLWQRFVRQRWGQPKRLHSPSTNDTGLDRPLDKVQDKPHPFNPNFKIKTGRQIKAHNTFFVNFYLRQLALLTGLGIISVSIVYFGVLWLQRFDHIKSVRDFFASPITFYVFYWAVAGYSLLVYSMLNSVFFFFLSRPHFTLRALGVGIIVNIVVGFVLSRMFVYWFSVIGLTLGGVAIAVMTTRYALRVLRKLDYYYYSAY